MLIFAQTYYFFIVTILAFLTGFSVCLATTQHRIWPKGMILPAVGLGLLLQTIYLPIPGSDSLLVSAIGATLIAGSVLGLALGVILQIRRDARIPRLL
ncbi:hypothetical protein GCM10011360_20000 [Primorskyibacter flagellatus]|jgi:hypothetical protein|uniref:Uncharacterized protein n=1 Tax=Primorskyibacter flagellatus TaxID=1387277 RepID=A0A917A6X6_9RHOB|nr:hypothetical protein [Primorskyibacter flagellatus]GGE32076.1 hypothetical protein GCM10011360_20000 [Primorskyibacter flagellatus]